MANSSIHYCIWCGTSCPVTCYPSHRKQYACHNTACIGHAPKLGACVNFTGSLTLSHDSYGNVGYRRTLCHFPCDFDRYLAHADKIKCHKTCLDCPSARCRHRNAKGERTAPSAVDKTQNSQTLYATDSPQRIKREAKLIVTLPATNPPSYNKSSIISDFDRAMPPRTLRPRKGVKKVTIVENPKVTARVPSTRVPSAPVPYASVPTNFCQTSSAAIPGDNMRNNMLGATMSAPWVSDDDDDQVPRDNTASKPSMTMILEGLYVGDAACVEDEKFLRANGINAVVTVLVQPVSSSPVHPLLRVVPLHDRLFVRARDTTTQDMMQFFPGVCKFIDKRLRPHLFIDDDDEDDTDARESVQEKPVLPGQALAAAAAAAATNHKNEPAKHRVLIHCEQNLSRSSTLAAAYVMSRKRKSDEEALALVQRKMGYGAWPNAAFREQLRLWWDIRFKLYRIEAFRVPCDEYEDYRFRLILERATQACGRDA